LSDWQPIETAPKNTLVLVQKHGEWPVIAGLTDSGWRQWLGRKLWPSSGEARPADELTDVSRIQWAAATNFWGTGWGYPGSNAETLAISMWCCGQKYR
jgi:hypothetical protein